jgi:putative FmdB family regulatory protein
MPTYVYECKACSHRYEKRQSMADEPEKVCPECTGEVRRVIFPVGIIFKGPGFYATDNKSGGATAVPSESEAATAASATSGNGKDGNGNGHKTDGAAAGTTKTESKTETKTESKPEQFGRKELKAVVDQRAKAE